MTRTTITNTTASFNQPAADEAAARREIIEIALSMSQSGLSPGRSGNVSCRWQSGMLITPSGMAYADLEPSDIVFVASDEDALGATHSVQAIQPPPEPPPTPMRIPSSEWRFHFAAYDVQLNLHAIVHTHSCHATVLACAHLPIPAFHYMVAVAGGSDIPLVPYATFGTQELSDHVRKGLTNRRACLMANHGQIAMGKTLPAALELAHEVEELAEQYYKVLLLRKPHILGANEMNAVLEKFSSYGQNA